MANDVTLVTKTACPFAERVRIVVALLGVEHDVKTIDVYDPPDWFLRLSPLGKVPLLLHDGAALVESTAIGEYLVEVFGAGSGLVPETPALRAEMRAWVQFDETALVPAFYRLLLEGDPARRADRREAYLGRLAVLERRLARGHGPFLLGAEPTLADVAIFTHLSRLAVVGPARGLPLEALGRGARSFLAAMSGLPAVSSAVASAEEAEADLAPYLAGTVAGETRRDITGLRAGG